MATASGVRFVLFFRRCARGGTVAVVLATAFEEIAPAKLGEHVGGLASGIAVH
jgi:hypothetical protein